MAHHRRLHRAARPRRRVRASARRLSGAQGHPRPQHGEGGGRDGGVGSVRAAARRAAEPRARRHARSHRVRRVDRHPGLARRARREGGARARGRLSPHQDQDQARLGRRRRGDDPRSLRRDSADGGRQRRLHAGGRRPSGPARRVRSDDDRAAARLRRHRRSRGAAAAAQDADLPGRIDQVGAHRARGDRGRRLPHHQHQAGARRRASRESIRLHDLCAAHGIPVWHGGMLESGIGRAANMHLSTLPNFSLPGDVAASKRYLQPRPDRAADRGRRRRHDRRAARPRARCVHRRIARGAGDAAPRSSTEARRPPVAIS